MAVMDATHYTETYVNQDEGYVYGEHTSEVAGTVFEDMSTGEAFRWLSREYGRCVSKSYVDRVEGNGPPMHVGWVFESRAKYEDSGDSYLRHTWVTFLKKHETKTVREYLDLSQR